VEGIEMTDIAPVNSSLFNEKSGVFALRELWNRIEDRLEFNPKWSNGTDYLDHAVTGDEAPKLEIGAFAKFQIPKPDGRYGVMLGSRFGNIVLFERYSGGKHGVVVRNMHQKIEDVLCLDKAVSRIDFLSHFWWANDNIALAIEGLFEDRSPIIPSINARIMSLRYAQGRIYDENEPNGDSFVVKTIDRVAVFERDGKQYLVPIYNGRSCISPLEDRKKDLLVLSKHTIGGVVYGDQADCLLKYNADENNLGYFVYGIIDVRLNDENPVKD